jgi:hypothetical protein
MTSLRSTRSELAAPIVDAFTWHTVGPRNDNQEDLFAAPPVENWVDVLSAQTVSVGGPVQIFGFGMLHILTMSQALSERDAGTSSLLDTAAYSPRIRYRIVRGSNPASPDEIVYRSPAINLTFPGFLPMGAISTFDASPPTGTLTYTLQLQWRDDSYKTGLVKRHASTSTIILGTGTRWQWGATNPTSDPFVNTPNWVQGQSDLVAPTAEDVIALYNGTDTSIKSGDPDDYDTISAWDANVDIIQIDTVTSDTQMTLLASAPAALPVDPADPIPYIVIMRAASPSFSRWPTDLRLDVADATLQAYAYPDQPIS